MPYFTKSQFSYCPLIWMFCSRTSMNKLNDIHEKCLRLAANDYDPNFNEQLESSHELSIHKTCINYFMIEVQKYLHVRSTELMTDIFTRRKNPYNIHNIHLFSCQNPRSVSFGAHETAFRASQLWQKVSIVIKYFSSKIKLWSCDDCPCNLCTRPFANTGSM